MKTVEKREDLSSAGSESFASSSDGADRSHVEPRHDGTEYSGRQLIQALDGDVAVGSHCYLLLLAYFFETGSRPEEIIEAREVGYRGTQFWRMLETDAVQSYVGRSII